MEAHPSTVEHSEYSPTLDDWDHAFDVARRFVAFDAYQYKESSATRALRKRRPSLTKEQAAALFDASLRMYSLVNTAISTNREALWQEYRATDSVGWDAIEADIQKGVPSVPISIIRQACCWMWYWHEMR